MKWTLQGIVEAVLAVVLLLWVLSVFFGGSADRGLSANYRAFESASRAGDFPKAAQLAARMSRSVAGCDLRLQAAALKLKAGDVAGAKADCQALASDGSSSPRARALAEAALATISLKGTTDAAALEPSLERAQAAVALDGECPDAHAILGVILARQGKREEALAELEKGFSMKEPPSAEPAASAYFARGALSSMTGRPDLAISDIERALAIRPGWKEAEAALIEARLGAVAAPQTPKADRERLLQALVNDPKAKTRLSAPDSILALGVAMNSLGRRHEAIPKFEAALKIPEARSAAALNLAALTIDELRKEIDAIEVHRRALLDELAKKSGGGASPWVTVTPNLKPLVLSATIQTVLGPRDVERLESLETKYMDLLRAAKEGGRLSQAEAAAADRAIAIVRLLQVEQCPVGADTDSRLAAAISALADLAKASDVWALRSQGILFDRSGRSAEAAAAFKKASRALPGDAPLSELAAASTRKPTLGDFRPGAGTSSHQRPLIGVTITVNAGNSQACEGALKMELDGKAVEPLFVGSDASYLPPDPVGDGEHVVTAAYTDPYGNQVEKSFKFYIDNAPPVVKKLTPGQNETVAGPKPTFVFEYDDEGSGIDPTSLQMKLSTVSATGPAFASVLVKDGRFQFTAFAEPKFKKDDPVPTDKVVFTSDRDLTKGTYVIEFDFTDNRGIHVRDKRWVFSIE